MGHLAVHEETFQQLPLLLQHQIEADRQCPADRARFGGQGDSKLPDTTAQTSNVI
jgi:hypothetical protein